MSAGEDSSFSFVDGTYIGDSVIGERVYLSLTSVASTVSDSVIGERVYLSLTSVASSSCSSISLVSSSF